MLLFKQKTIDQPHGLYEDISLNPRSVEMDLLNNELYLHEIESSQHNNVLLWR